MRGEPGVIPGFIKIEDDRSTHTQQTPGLAMHQQRDRGTVLHHVGQTLERVSGVKRHISAPGLENAEQADHHIQAALDTDRYSVIGPHTQFDQLMGHAVGLPVQRIVGQLLVFESQRDGLGSRPDLIFE